MNVKSTSMLPEQRGTDSHWWSISGSCRPERRSHLLPEHEDAREGDLMV